MLRVRFAQPVAQSSHAFLNSRALMPPRCGAKLRRIADVVTLIARPPVAPLDLRRRALQLRDEVQQLHEAGDIPRPASDIEGIAAQPIDVAAGQQKSVDEILDEKDVAHLL